MSFARGSHITRKPDRLLDPASNLFGIFQLYSDIMSIRLIAHRGYTAHYPENTLVAINAAIEAGAQFVEVDVQLAADGTPVLFHDRTLDRMCGERGAISDYSPQQLARFDASEPGRFGDAFVGTPVATLSKLADLIRRSPEIQFFIELKCQKERSERRMFPLEHITRVLEGLQDQCTLISFGTEALCMARMQRWRTGLITDRWRGPGSCSADFLFCDVDGLPPSGSLHLPGTHLAVYEVADPEEARQLSARGVDFIETFAIGEMRAALSNF